MLNIHSNREDIRATLPNLLSILSVGEIPIRKSYAMQESISTTHLAVDTGDQPMAAISETSIDMIIALPAKKIFSASEENMNAAGFHG